MLPVRTLALLARSLRVDSRLLRTHLFRLFFAGFIGLNLVLAQSQSAFFGAPGLRFFSQMTYLNFVFISLAGISIFATAISEEKEEDTLGLLKMAGLSPVAILLGKSTSRLLSTVLLLLIQVPFALLAITLGGVTLHQVLDAYCALSAYMLLLANLGLFWSVVCHRSQRACSAMTLCLIGFFAGPWLVQELLNEAVRSGTLGPSAFVSAGHTLCSWMIEASVLQRASVNMATGFDQTVFSVQFLSNLAAALAFFLLSWGLFERCTSDSTAAKSPGRIFVFPGTSRFRMLGSGRAWKNAIVWKDFHFVAGGRTFLLIKFVLYGAVAAGFAWYLRDDPQDRVAEILGGGMMVSSLVMVMVETALYAARVFENEIKEKTLPTLMMLPVSTARIALSKVAGCLLGLTPACCFLVLGCLIDPQGPSHVGDVLTSGGWWFGLLYFLTFLHLTMLFSLRLRWGALPLAFGTMLMSTWCCALGMSGTNGPGPGGEDVFLFILDVSLCVAIVFLQITTVAFLETAASE